MGSTVPSEQIPVSKQVHRGIHQWGSRQWLQSIHPSGGFAAMLVRNVVRNPVYLDGCTACIAPYHPLACSALPVLPFLQMN